MKTPILILLAVYAIGIAVIAFLACMIYICSKYIEMSMIVSILLIGIMFGALFTIGFYSFIFNKDK